MSGKQRAEKHKGSIFVGTTGVFSFRVLNVEGWRLSNRKEKGTVELFDYARFLHSLLTTSKF